MSVDQKIVQLTKNRGGGHAVRGHKTSPRWGTKKPGTPIGRGSRVNDQESFAAASKTGKYVSDRIHGMETAGHTLTYNNPILPFRD